MDRISSVIQKRSVILFNILFIIILSNSMISSGVEVNPTHPIEDRQLCTDCHNLDEDSNKLIVDVTPAVSLTGNSKLNGSGASIQSGIMIQGGSQDCVLCHDTGGSGAPPDKRIDVSAIKQSVHRNLNNASINTTLLSDTIDKACWACHGDGTEPLTGHQSNYATPYSCGDCHNRTSNLIYTNLSLILNLSAKKVHEHLQAPYYEQISSTVNSTNADCNGCHDKSKAAYTDSGLSLSANVSHYASKTGLASPSTNCNLCHKDSRNSSSYWANIVRHPARSEDNSFCRNCHNTTLAIDLHSQPLVKPSNIHSGFDWQNDDYNEISPLGANEACLSCHGGGHATTYRVCENCHLENGSGPVFSSWQRPDLNETIPRVYAHTNFSTAINVPNQSRVYPPSPAARTFSSCYSFNSTTLAGTCHGISYYNRSISGGYFAFKTSANSRSSPYHVTKTIDTMPNTTDCLFCHKQTDPGIRMAWGNAIQITGGTHNWYMGDDNSKCWTCHVSTGNAPKDFHSDTLQGGGGSDCIACHAPNDVNISKFARHANINTSDGTNNVTNNDCWTCHYQKDMNRSNVYLCDSCHKNSSGIVPVTDPALLVGNLQHGSNKCKDCHAPDTYHVQGTAGPRGRIENPGWPLIDGFKYAGCHDCHRTYNGLDEPFHGPGIEPR
ncbi:MAG: hypothetical protein FIB08_07700, partial [Candidatus Methanoperedens sp.]|nr:hypothetical protein [Candidatus Methanoperedens sp.]